MNQIQEMLRRANQAQKQLDRAYAELKEKEFVKEKGGLVKIVVKGDKSLEKIEIEKDALEPENKEMLEEAILMAIREAQDEVQKEADKIDESVTGKAGLPF